MNVNEKLPQTNNLYPVYIVIFLTKDTFNVCTYKYFEFNCIFACYGFYKYFRACELAIEIDSKKNHVD